MKIVFFLDIEKYPYEGVVRPFINWAKELSKKDYEVYFILLNCGKELLKSIENIDRIKHKKNLKNFDEVINYLNLIRPNIILTDDNFRRLKLLTKIKSKIQIKTGVYVQTLFGIHSIADIFNLEYLPIKERMLFKLVRVFPFNLLKIQYKKLLLNQDIIIANSQITATLLYTLYGIESDGIVYPPVDTEIFKPQDIKKKNQILLYLGSHAGDTDENFVREICKILKNKELKILVMGNKILQEKLSKEFAVEIVSEVSDEELAKIYSECKLTICPQRWEQFGYVVAESIVCGTPVLTFNMMGPKEIIEQTNFGLLANNKREFLKYLTSLELYLNNLKVIKKINEFDIKMSSIRLIKVMENV